MDIVCKKKIDIEILRSNYLTSPVRIMQLDRGLQKHHHAVWWELNLVLFALNILYQGPSKYNREENNHEDADGDGKHPVVIGTIQFQPAEMKSKYAC